MATSTTVKKIMGKDGSVTINGTNFCVTKWSVTGTCTNEETPDTCSGGFMTRTPDMRDFKGSFSANYDGVTPPPVHDGDELIDLVFSHKVGGTVTPAFSAVSAWVSEFAITNPIPGLVTFDISFEGNGQYQYGALPTS